MEWNDEDINRITNKLMERDRSGLREEELPDGFLAAQLLYDVNNFYYNLEWQTEHWKRILCIRVKEEKWQPIIVDVRSIYRDWLPYFNIPLQRARFRVTEGLLELMKLEPYSESPDRVRSYFRMNFSNFIKTRLFGISNSSKNEDIEFSRNESSFTVYSQSPNLRILYSPAFIFGNGNVFGYPSTPVTSYLSPGDYIFGAEGVGINPIWEDQRIYKIPYDKQATLLSI